MDMQIPQRAEKPLRAKVERSFNLSTIFNEPEIVEEKHQIDFESLPKNKFTQNDIDLAWNEILNNLQKENKVVEFNALQSGKLQLKESHIIQIEFSSSSLANEFALKQESIVLFLREKFNNYSLKFEIKISEGEAKNFIKSKEEIFKDMIEVNPILLKMKEKFGLDLNSAE